MKIIDTFRMERPDLIKVGDEVTVTEYMNQTMQGQMYSYIINPAVAMSGFVPAREKINILKGIVKEVKSEESYWTISVEFED